MIIEAIRCSCEIYEQALLQSAWCGQQMVGQPRAAVIIDTPLTSIDGYMVNTSQWWLEAAKIRNEHRKVQSLYENK